MWAAIIICLAIAMMLGPVMMMRPSASQTRLAALRTQANALGYRVRIAEDPRAGRDAQIAVYSLPWNKDDKNRPEWKLVKQNISHELHFLNYWDWQGAGRPHVDIQEALKHFLNGVDMKLVAIGASRSGVDAYWEEKLSGEESQVALERLRSLLQKIVDANGNH